eukprot:gene44160-53987_t
MGDSVKPILAPDINSSIAPTESVTVRWSSNRVSLKYKASQASVTTAFMNNMTVRNQYIVYGNPFFPKPPPEEQEDKVSLCSLTLPPSSLALSPLYAEQQSSRDSKSKILQSIDPCNMPIVSAYDFWLFVEALGYFSPLSAPSDLLQFAQLRDTGFEQAVADWHLPLERQLSAEQLQQLLRGERSCIIPPLAPPKPAVLERELQYLGTALLQTNLQVNEVLCKLHAHAQQQHEEIWKEAQQRAGEDEQVRILCRKIEGLKKKRSKR